MSTAVGSTTTLVEIVAIVFDFLALTAPIIVVSMSSSPG
jgi:hypothetical protein